MAELSPLRINEIAQELENAPNDIMLFVKTSPVLPLQYRVVINMHDESILAMLMHLIKVNPRMPQIIAAAIKQMQ